MLAKKRDDAFIASKNIETLEGFSDCRISFRPATVPRLGKKRKKAVVLEEQQVPRPQLAQQAGVCPTKRKAVDVVERKFFGHRYGTVLFRRLQMTPKSYDEFPKSSM